MINTRKLTCPNCGTAVPAANINMQHLAAACPTCDTIFNFEPGTPKSKRRKVKPPASLTIVTDEPDDLYIRQPWRQAMDWLDHVSFWSSLAMAVFGFSAAFGLLTDPVRDVPETVISIILTIVGVVFAYFFVSYLVNTTHIWVNDTEMKTQHKPLPMWGMGTVARDEVAQITMRPSQSRSGSTDNPTHYNIYAVTADGKETMLMYDTPRDQAEYLAQRLEAYIDVPPEPFDNLIDDETGAAEVDEVLYIEEEQARRMQS